MIVGLMKNFVKARRRPKYGSKEDFACTLQRLIDNPSPDEPYVAPCGGTGNHSDPRCWEERFEERLYGDDDESFGAQLNRLLRSRKLERENTEREEEAIQLREPLEKGYRVHGCDKLEQPVSIVEP